MLLMLEGKQGREDISQKQQTAASTEEHEAEAERQKIGSVREN